MRISSQIALFPSPLISGRQPTAVGFKIPALRVANDDLSLRPLIRLAKATQIRPETELTRRPEAEPEPRRLGTIARGPWAVGTVVGPFIGGHRGRREATAIRLMADHKRAGKGLIHEYNCTLICAVCGDRLGAGTARCRNPGVCPLSDPSIHPSKSIRNPKSEIGHEVRMHVHGLHRPEQELPIHARVYALS